MTERAQSNLPGGLRKFIGVLLLLGTVGLSTCQAYRHDGSDVDKRVGVRSALQGTTIVALGGRSPDGLRPGAD